MNESVQILEAVAGSEGREWDVLLIEAGLSKNGNYYPAETLKAAAPLFEGAVAYADHQADGDRRRERSVKDKVGRYGQVAYGSHDVRGRVVEGIKARFKIIAPWLRETLLEAARADESDFVGLSIDAEGKIAKRQHGGKLVNWVEQIIRVHSVDVVTNPAAGGQVVRLVASEGGGEPGGSLEDKVPENTSTATGQQVDVAAIVADVTKAVLAGIKEQVTPGADETKAELAAIKESMRLREQTDSVDTALKAATGLSDIGGKMVRGRLLEAANRRDLTTDEVTAAIKEQADYEAAFAQQTISPVNRSAIKGGDDQGDKLDKALQGWFAGKAIDGVRPLGSLQEGYCRWTGIESWDVDVLDFYGSFASGYDSRKAHKRVRESLTRSSWGDVFADNLYVSMVRDYREDTIYSQWRKFVSDIESVPDFQTRHWVRLGGYADLAGVSEQATYPQLTSPTDEASAYAISKRGGVDDVTMEMLVDGRSNRMRAIPERMSRAAKRTLHNFVLALITTGNPTLDYDSVALYHSSHANTGTTALSVAGLDATQVAMRDQTAYNQSAEILGARNKVKYLIVPNELDARAQRIVAPSDGYTFALSSTPDADTSMDPARFKGAGIEVHVYDQLTDATDWWAVANPAEVPTMVIGFLNGAEEPELFVQDDAKQGVTFSADKIQFKVRHIYGGDVIEHRSFYRQVVS